MRRTSAGAALLLLLAGCGGTEPDPPQGQGGAGVDASAGSGQVPIYERGFAFAGFAGDSMILVPWIMRTTSSQDSVVREANGWLGRRSTWDAFYSERWTTPPTRAPSRILPYGSMRLLVQAEDVVDGIVFEDGARRLELALGEVRSSWGGPRGESIELVHGIGFVADQRVEGMIAHLARASAGGTPPGGDWALLVGGDSVHLVLAADVEHGGENEPVYRGYANDAGSERLWTEARVTWTTTEAFPPARRDIPVAWRITSEDGSLNGELERVSADVQAGSGLGPLLPVRALYEVQGTVRMAGRSHAVRGVLVHERR